MAKVFTGKVISTKMQDTVIVEVTRFVPHKLYKKLMKRSKNFKVDSAGHELTVGRRVKIVETKPMSKAKHFKIMAVITEEHEKSSEVVVKADKKIEGEKVAEVKTEKKVAVTKKVKEGKA